MFGQGTDMEHAINWLMEHQEDADIDDPIPEEALAPEAMDVDAASGGEYWLGLRDGCTPRLV